MKKTDIAALALLAGALILGAAGCQRSEPEEAGKKLGQAVRGATQDVKSSADKVAGQVDQAAKAAVNDVREFGKGVKEGWKSGDK